MKESFEIIGIEHLSTNNYKISGRALKTISVSDKLLYQDKIVEVCDIIYYSRNMPFIDPPMTCYLIVKSEADLANQVKFLLPVGTSEQSSRLV